ncbi:MAG: addiction module protein [Planctomycetota bacterium]|nr:addiction module protein [Planctomycetota bacterium]MDA0918741.1 addiction module protein [Planctomycetota bacterium]MDA1158684.1 addiction module protein [Planctomycetota bacterium]
MTPIARQLLESALKLPGSERVALASSLFESLEREQDGQEEDAAIVQAEWNNEICKRVEELDSGQVTTIPWSVARRMIQGEQINESVGD